MTARHPRRPRTRNVKHCRLAVTILFLPLLSLAVSAAESTEERPAATNAPQRTPAFDARDADVEIIAAEDRVIYEYRVNGVITAIKVVPKHGRPYYMVPIDGSPHYEINHDTTLYPKWILLEW